MAIRLTHFVKGTFIIFITFAICLLIGEFAVRLLHLAPEIYAVKKGRFRLASNPLIGYELVPNFESTTDGPMLDFKGKANSLGFRDREHSIEKAEGVYRIIVLGDSITQGLCIENNYDLFTSVFERILIKEKTTVEVFNFGVSGYNTQQEIETLREKGLQFSPDLVILTFCVNDVMRECGSIIAYLSQDALKHRRILQMPRFLMKSALCRMLYASIEVIRQRFSPPQNAFKAITKNTIPENFKNLGDLAKENGFEVLVVWFPRLDNMKIDKELRRLKGIRNQSISNGLRFLDLSNDLELYAKQKPIAADSIHPNQWGHQCAGETIACYIRTEIFKEADD